MHPPYRWVWVDTPNPIVSLLVVKASSTLEQLEAAHAEGRTLEQVIAALKAPLDLTKLKAVGISEHMARAALLRGKDPMSLVDEPDFEPYWWSLNKHPYTYAQWRVAEGNGIRRKTLKARLDHGWDIEKAISTPPKPAPRRAYHWKEAE